MAKKQTLQSVVPQTPVLIPTKKSSVLPWVLFSIVLLLLIGTIIATIIIAANNGKLERENRELNNEVADLEDENEKTKSEVNDLKKQMDVIYKVAALTVELQTISAKLQTDIASLEQEYLSIVNDPLASAQYLANLYPLARTVYEDYIRKSKELIDYVESNKKLLLKTRYNTIVDSLPSMKDELKKEEDLLSQIIRDTESLLTQRGCSQTNNSWTCP